MSNVKTIGCDNGHFGIKIYAGLGKKHSISSRCRIGGSSQTEFGSNGPDSSEIVFSTDGELYTTGSLQSEVTTFADYPLSPINRVLVHSCLHQAAFTKGPEYKQLDLVLGLPYAQYYSKKHPSGRNEDLISGMEKNLLVPVQNIATTEDQFTINNCMTVPEGMAAWFSYIVKEEVTNGRVVPVFNEVRGQETTVFIDIGGGTTEVVTVAEKKIQKDYSGTISQGSHRITEDLRRYIYELTDVSSISERKMHQALLSKKINVNGEVIDLTQAIKSAQSKLIHKINGFTDSLLRDVKGDIDNKVLVGGTSIDLKDELMNWQGVSLSDDPLFENAKGMYLFKKYLA
ncbi:hypothetical protein GCM10011607_28700 [Shewanella inventionis]|uniref:ParM/StbA family protein n=1 Tax=Shewanella inventionis TaxID=1738770 RepID=A0ABQ1JH88_9GAMM|nr:ParM/StbA family protein [Shewanella inventionis]GGB66284.1 hypothetical protein GCM10011607_28700 [Shewanella inventionis]